MSDNPAPKKTRRGGRRPVLRFAPVLKALEETGGNISAVARKAGVSRASIHEFITNHPDLRMALDQARESRLDLAEDALTKAVEQSEPWAVCFLLKCLGKKRGYVERQELTGAEGDAIKVEQVSIEERRRRVESLIAQARQQCVQTPS